MPSLPGGWPHIRPESLATNYLKTAVQAGIGKQFRDQTPSRLTVGGKGVKSESIVNVELCDL